MAHDEATVGRGTGGDDDKDEVVCPMCHVDFPKLSWRGQGRTRYLCCGKSVCDSCFFLKVSRLVDAAAEEGARRGAVLTPESIRAICDETVSCPFCRSAVRVSDSERLRQAQVHADLGKPWALWQVGRFHSQGTGTYKNEALAVEYFRKAAESGFTLAQHHLGDCYMVGAGTEIDLDEAAAWFERAAAAGFALSQNYLGNILTGAAGPSSAPIDHERAFGLFLAAAEQGHGPSQSRVAVAYATGRGVSPPSLDRAIFWGRRAAMQGVADAQNNLATSYFNLDDTTSDADVPVTAPVGLFWLRKAAAAGSPTATRILPQIEDMMSGKCAFCSAVAPAPPARLLRCSRCKGASYCSKDHQKEHWRVHKRWCDEVKAAGVEYDLAEKPQYDFV